MQHAAVPRWLQRGLRARLGISSSKDCALNSLRLTRWNQVFSLTDGSFTLQRLLNSASVQQSCGRGALQLSKHSSVLNRVPCPGFLFPPSLPLLLLAFRSLRVLFFAGGFLLLASRTCRCGRLLDVLGHHRAACARASVLGGRGFSVESAAARVCREARARVSTNVFVRDLDLAVVGQDGRRLEVVADGLPLFGGAQLAIDTTLVSPIRADGLPRRQCADVDGAALAQARRRKQRTYPELDGHGRARLVVLAAKVGGRWSEEARAFVSQLAKAKARSVPRILAGRARQAWQHRWATLLACASARAFAVSAGPPFCCWFRRGGSFHFGCHHSVPSRADLRILRSCCWRAVFLVRVIREF